jgi:hypothetical protein
MHTASAEIISAQIDSKDFPSGDKYRGVSLDDANIWAASSHAALVAPGLLFY